MAHHNQLNHGHDWLDESESSQFHYFLDYIGRSSKTEILRLRHVPGCSWSYGNDVTRSRWRDFVAQMLTLDLDELCDESWNDSVHVRPGPCNED
jgi:hypothetical protein